MSSKKNILVMLESQVDKIVLVVIVLISLALLWFYVLSNPYAEKVGGQKLSPGEIDKTIRQESDRLMEELDKLPSGDYGVYAETHLSDFDEMMECPISNVTSELVIQFPGVGDAIIEEDRLYEVPLVPLLYEVQRATLRGAAKVPVDEVGPANPYESAETNLTDIDLVTIAGRFDMQILYNNFRLSFDGPGLKSSWKDPKLATPVFAKMQLQRRTKQVDDSWGDWQDVPRTKIDLYQNLLGQLPLNPDEMQFGIDVWMSQYQNPDVQLDILQPQSYLFEISKTAWMPPQFLIETQDIIEKGQELEKKRLREERQKASETQRGGDRRTTTRDRRSTTRRDPMMNAGAERDRTTRTTRDKERTVTDVERDVEAEILDTVDKLEARRDPLMVWAHDDTAEPGQTYQYRIRLGVFNPIMGKDWFKQTQAEFKQQTVLWSQYSEPTEEIDVPEMLHVFPMETIADASKAVEGAKVEVAKYHMGQWQSYEFEVFPGQIIGSAVTLAEIAEQGVEEADREEALRKTNQDEEDEVDFTTSMVVVDLLKEINWGSRIRRSDYYQMLYYDADGIVRVPIGKTNWPKDVKKSYEIVQKAMEEDVDVRTEGFGRPGMQNDPMMDEMMMF